MKNSNQLISFWNLIKTRNIIIPIIQRDYAQGRENESNLRIRFLKKLKEILDNYDGDPGNKKSGNNGLILDFIYGTPTFNNGVAPLDGQQRLTTLWLLHWYIGYKTRKLENGGREILKSFTYETRSSSRDFCKYLCELEYKNDCNNLLGHLENQTWFFSQWKQDPTIKAMLIMLFGTTDKTIEKGSFTDDNIESVFGQESPGSLKRYWDLLTADSSSECPITFNYTTIGTRDLPLSDDLYIKMNARGKPLTSFENFKAEIIKWISENNSTEESVRVAAWIDNDWSDVFWDYGKGKFSHSVDEIFYAFINRLCFNYILTEREGNKFKLTDNNAATNKYYNYFNDTINRSENDKRITFNSIDFYLPFVKNLIDDMKILMHNIWHIDYKDLQIERYNNFCFIPNYIFNPDATPKTILDNNQNEIYDFTSINQQERVVFYGLCKYLKSRKEEDDEENSLQHWMRFLWNLTYEKDHRGADLIRNISNMQLAINLIDRIKNPRKIYRELAQYDMSDWKEGKESLLHKRFKEEIEKAKMILYGDPEIELPRKPDNHDGPWDWESAIILAENHDFLKGSVGVLFHNDKGETDWQNFEKKYKNACEYFDVNENNKEIIKGMIPYLTDENILDVFSNYNLHNTNYNIGEILRIYPNVFHNYLLKENKAADLSRLQSDLMSLCSDNESCWIHKNWVNNKHILSNYATRSGNYESSSYLLDDDFFPSRYEILEEANSWADDLDIIFKKPADLHLPQKMLYIDFNCVYNSKTYKFKWKVTDWVDMIDENGTNLWRTGLHSKYNGENVDHSFTSATELIAELKRCIAGKNQG